MKTDVWAGHESVIQHENGVYLLDREKIKHGDLTLQGSHRYFAVYISADCSYYGEWLAYETLRAARKGFSRQVALVSRYLAYQTP